MRLSSLGTLIFGDTFICLIDNVLHTCIKRRALPDGIEVMDVADYTINKLPINQSVCIRSFGWENPLNGRL